MMPWHIYANMILRRPAHKEIIVVNCNMYIHAANITLIPADKLYEWNYFPPTTTYMYQSSLNGCAYERINLMMDDDSSASHVLLKSYFLKSGVIALQAKRCAWMASCHVTMLNFLGDLLKRVVCKGSPNCINLVAYYYSDKVLGWHWSSLLMMIARPLSTKKRFCRAIQKRCQYVAHWAA